MSSLKENKMGTMPIGRLLLTMALPMALSMLVQALYNVVDSAFVAKISDVNQDALNAVSLAFPVQNIMIGIATAMKPALLIADEPTTAIDAITQYEILNELLHIKENHNTAMIFISHDLNAISRVADRIVVLNHGAVVDRGDFRHILHHAQDPYTKLLVEKRADVMRRYTAVLNGKKETAHA